MFHKAVKILALVAMIVTLAGCSTATPTVAEPTPDNAATLASVSTQAAQTIVAGITANAPTVTNTPAATETPLPTNTPEPTATMVPPTNTPVPPTATWIPATLAPTATATPSDYSCTIKESSPSSGADYKKNEDFDARWVIKNTGEKTWSGNDADFKFSSGTKMQQDGDAYDLNEDVEEGESYTFVLDMKAPDTTGRFYSTFVLHGVTTYCTLTVTIDVVE